MGKRIFPGKLRLPRRGRLPVTGPLDAIDRYYRPLIGLVMRWRLRWVLDCLPGRRVGRLLEVGYGSGIFQYELARRAELPVAMDIHPHHSAVKRLLREDGLGAELVRADGARLPFPEGVFDAVITVSVVEHTPDPGRCLGECRRVLRRGGVLICLLPRELRWADLAYRLLTGLDPESDFRGGRRRMQEALLRALPGCRRLRRPSFLPRSLAPYEVVLFEKGRPRLRRPSHPLEAAAP